MVFKRKLLIPKEIKEMYPISAEAAAAKRSNDESIRDIITGASSKLLLVIGPCSAVLSQILTLIFIATWKVS